MHLTEAAEDTEFIYMNGGTIFGGVSVNDNGYFTQTGGTIRDSVFAATGDI